MLRFLRFSKFQHTDLAVNVRSEFRYWKDSLNFAYKPYRDNSAFLGRHSMMIVGYKKKRSLLHRNELYLLIKNTWGEDWGENGMAYVKIKSAHEMGLNDEVIQLFVVE